MAVADGVITADAIACADIETAPLLGGGQILARLVEAHGIVDDRPVHVCINKV